MAVKAMVIAYDRNSVMICQVVAMRLDNMWVVATAHEEFKYMLIIHVERVSNVSIGGILEERDKDGNASGTLKLAVGRESKQEELDEWKDAEIQGKTGNHVLEVPFPPGPRKQEE